MLRQTLIAVCLSACCAAEALWSLAPITDPEPPGVMATSWPERPLDQFILAKIEADGLTPTPVADRRSLVRRAYLDLHGLPPTTEQIDRFLLDNRPDAWPRLIDELLASPHYGERWGRHWLDVARYADSNGMDENIAHPGAWRYRDYVIQSFNDDKPFDQFITEQLAGDLLPYGSLEQRRAQTVGVGFLSVGPKMLACDDPDKMRRDIVDEQIDTTGRAFIGMTFGCARCHDHKFDPVSIEDYYALAGVFMSTQTLTKYSVVAKMHQHDLSAPEQLERREAIKDYTEYQKEDSTPQGDKHQIDTELAHLRDGLADPWSFVGVTEYPAEDQKVHLRGDYLTLGEVVPRRLPNVLAGTQQTAMPKDQSGRLQLANWITSKENTLTARVIANRLWRWHFGRGLVPTPDNFGQLGERPTHPLLLDHLASKILESNWSLKSMHREIMTSATYRQSSRATTAQREQDPDNALFARWQPRRMESEVVRDAILFKANRLDLSSNGPRIKWNKGRYIEKEWDRFKASTARSVYLPVLRSSGYDGQNAFDFPDPAMLTGDRRSSTVVSQALYLMNSSFVHENSTAVAQRLLDSTADTPVADRANWLVLHLLGRPATGTERQRAETFIASYSDDPKAAWAAFSRALFASNEFLYIE